MDITYYFIGLLTGVSVSTFFVGKELYKYYTKFRIQQKQLDRILKLNDNFKKKKVKSIKSQNLNGNSSSVISKSLGETKYFQDLLKKN